MIASLPMYDHPALQTAWDALWTEIRRKLKKRGIAVPDTLERGRDVAAQWRDPELLLGQTCGLPFRLGLHESVTLVGAFDFGLTDTPAGHYHSIFIARKDDDKVWPNGFCGARLAYNEPQSHSGWYAATRAPVVFRPFEQTGSHAASARCVADGGADIAALDAVTWRILAEHESYAKDLKVVGRSETAPGLPLITAFPHKAGRLGEAVADGIAALNRVDREALGLKGFVRVPKNDYLAVPIPPTPEEYVRASG